MRNALIPPTPPTRRGVHLGKIVTADTAGWCTFTLDAQGAKLYGPCRYQRPPAVTQSDGTGPHTHDLLETPTPPEGTPAVALFWGEGLADAHVLTIGWPA